jgi:hypothetical protein
VQALDTTCETFVNIRYSALMFTSGSTGAKKRWTKYLSKTLQRYKKQQVQGRKAQHKRESHSTTENTTIYRKSESTDISVDCYGLLIIYNYTVLAHSKSFITDYNEGLWRRRLRLFTFYTAWVYKNSPSAIKAGLLHIQPPLTLSSVMLSVLHLWCGIWACVFR